MRMRCRRPTVIAGVAAIGHAASPNARSVARWQVIRSAWMAELGDALRRTKGNLELAVAIAATMVFAD